MAQFDESGCPADFLAVVRKMQADIQDRKNAVAKENLLIKEFEQHIPETLKSNKLLQEENAELEASFRHMNALYNSEIKHLQSLKETGDLLKDQAKQYAEKLEIEKEKNQNIKSNCEMHYQEYTRKFDERMHFYETRPLVPEYKLQLERNLELKKARESLENEKRAKQEELENVKKQVPQKPSRAIRKWGIKVAQLMKEVQNIDIPGKTTIIQMLEKEILESENKKKEIEEQQERQNRTKVENHKKNENTLKLRKVDPKNDGTSQHQSLHKTLLPDFLSLTPLQTFRAHGSSGSSLQSSTHSSSLPNIPSFFANMKPRMKLDTMRVTQGSSLGESLKSSFAPQLKEPTTNNSPAKVQRSLSLTTLLPEVKLAKRNESSPKLAFKSGQSLADWLSPPSWKNNQASADKRSKFSSEGPSAMQRNNQISGRTKAERASWPMPHKRLTEVPLLRQVQEKMLQQKITEDQDMEVAEITSDSTKSTPMEIEKNERQEGEEQQNLLTLFDGPSYTVEMKDEEAKKTKKPISNRTSPKSRSTPHHISIEEHQRMMAEIQKSPEDNFRFQSHVMPTEGGESSYLISPSRQNFSPEHSPVTSPVNLQQTNDFQFAVPCAPPPGKRGATGSPEELFSFSFGSEQPKSPEESFSLEGFGFGGSGDASRSAAGLQVGSNAAEEESSSDSFGFIFGASEKADTAESKSSFSFVFGDEPKSPPDLSSVFSFGTSSPTHSKSSKSSFFDHELDETDDTPSSSFASIFGCRK